MNMLYFIQFLRDISIDLCYAHLAKMAPSSSSAYSVRQDLWFLGGDGKVKDKGPLVSGWGWKGERQRTGTIRSSQLHSQGPE